MNSALPATLSMAKNQTAILLICLTIIPFSCDIIPSLGCEISITEDYIESSCGLINGVQFEQLEVEQLDSNNLPNRYKVLVTFQCFNPGVEGVQKYWPDRLYFDKPNGHYLWQVDSMKNGTYVRDDIYRIRTDKEDTTTVRVITDSAERQRFLDSFNKSPRIINRNSTAICPVKFKENTWYFVNFANQRNEAYLYIDKQMKYNLHLINLPTNF